MTFDEWWEVEGRAICYGSGMRGASMRAAWNAAITAAANRLAQDRCQYDDTETPHNVTVARHIAHVESLLAKGEE